ncbi:MAG: vitamin B12 dependent-methionine synthase activation domain-containing protein [Sphaerochaetaceae bacterium]|jgi:hypothetical protein|nr:vitamin B12 dependent-methionine synthase activation domain-containing protein [Sphaerochaetaceae bacterium]MDY0372104.1 vitamin B12 dependent-methionine synthase activation domain-containing protein [Sphaerochaetaceae bacterium]
METKSIILTPTFTPSLTRYKRSIRFDNIDDAQSDALALYDEAAQKLQPKVLLQELFIDSHGIHDGLATITIGDIQFEGKALKVLKDVHRVIGYVTTCGAEMETFDLASLDMLAFYWLDMVKNQALAQARKAMFSYCREHLGITKPLSVNPGSGNVDIWPIQQMQGLFEILGGGSQVGVSLTESSLMVPNKTISGLIFASADSDYESCAYCERERCPNRRVPFKERM